MKQLKSTILNRKLKRLKREVSFKSLSKCETALILYNCSDSEMEKGVREFARTLKEEGLKVYTLGYFDVKDKKQTKPNDELNYLYFDRKEVGYLGQLKNSKQKRLIVQSFDLLIDLNLKNDFVIRAISSLSKSKFKVGIENDYALEVYDLTVNVKNDSIKQVCAQILHYLKMINA